MSNKAVTIRQVDRKTASALRKRLNSEGYQRVVGSGRGRSWTRHSKGNEVIFVEKSFDPGDHFYVWGVDTKTDRTFEVKT